MADPDGSQQAPRPRKNPRTYARGGSICVMVRLLEKGETHQESRLAWWLVVAGIAVAVLAVATSGFLGR